MIPCLYVRGEGAPRALGHAQGLTWRYRTEPGWRRWLRGTARPRVPRGFGRELAHHFPHFAERVAGLARGAGCPRDVLYGALLGASGAVSWVGEGEEQNDELSGEVQLAARSGPPAEFPANWVVRDVAASGGYRALGLAPAWLPAGLAGVNERGLAGVALRFESVPALTHPPHPASRDCEQVVRAPGWLLLDQCLERCDAAEAAVEWCAARPGGGLARLWFADASGARRGIELDGPLRRRIDPDAPGRFSSGGVGRGPRFALHLGGEGEARGISFTWSGAPTRTFRFD